MNLTLDRIGYDLSVVQGDGDIFPIGDIVDGLVWEEYSSQLAQRMTVGAINAKAGKRRLAQLLPNGAEVRLRAGYGDQRGERFRGRVFRNGTRWAGGPGHHEVVAYDPLFYLMRSQDDRYYKAGMTATEIIADICRAWGIPIDLDGETPGVKLSKKAFKGRYLAEMVTKVLAETRKRDGGRWMLLMHEGRATLRLRGYNQAVYYFKAEDVVDELAVDRSIEHLVTKVKVVGREKGGTKVLATATSDLFDDYGALQAIIDRSAYDSPGATEKAAKRLLREQGFEQKIRTFVAPDVPELRRGHRIHMEAKTLDDFYLVRDVSHDALNRTMALTVYEKSDDDIDIAWRESGLDEWVPPDQRGGPRGGVGAHGFGWPASGSVTGHFGDPRTGHTHEGVDIGIPVGTPVFAAKAGRVSFSGTQSGYGTVIYINHEDGWQTRYAHLSVRHASVGAKVDRGDRIALSGNTGTSTGPHLHFEIIKGGTPVDPEKILP